MFAKITPIFLFVLHFATSATLNGPTECPKVTTKPDFDPDKYLGYWYRTIGNINSISEPGSNCIRANYRELNETFVYASNVGYTETGVFEQVCGFAYQVDPKNEPGHLIVQFPYGPPGDYLVLGTDYESFTCVYSCRKKGDKVELFKSILTRDPHPTIETWEKGLEIYRQNGLETEDFVEVLHENCLYDNPDISSCENEQ